MPSPKEENNMTNKSLTPAKQFAATVEHLAADFLSRIADPEQVVKATGRLALAVRAAGVANPKVYECSPASVAQAVAMSALTGLMPGGPKPEVYLIPRSGKLEWQISARGLQALAGMHGWQRIVAHPVHVSDHYVVVKGTEERLEHIPGQWPASLEDCKGFWVEGVPTTGPRVLVDVPLGIIDARRKKAQSDSVWRSWPIEMAQKTAVVWAISRGYFGSLERAAEMQHIQQHESGAYREEAPRPQPRPTAIEYEADASAEVLDALEVEA
jgi:recombinational DNA repair protein RecT